VDGKKKNNGKIASQTSVNLGSFWKERKNWGLEKGEVAGALKLIQGVKQEEVCKHRTPQRMVKGSLKKKHDVTSERREQQR